MFPSTPRFDLLYQYSTPAAHVYIGLRPNATINGIYKQTLALVTKLIAICGRSLIPRLLQFHPEWPLRITDLAIRLCEERDNTLGQTIDFDVQLNWMCTLTQIVDFCLSIADPGQINPTDIALFARMTVTYEDTGEVRNCGLLFVCDIILKHLPLFREGTVLFPEAAVDQLIKNFGLFGGVFYRHKLRGDTTVYHPAILATNGKAEAVQSDPLIAAFEGFGWASMVRHCCAPECRETFATAGRAFARCSGCGILRYCSRPCLTRAWKHPTLPHKAVCTKLRVLRERTNLPRDRDLDPDRDRQAFFDACGADEGLTALAQDCGKHLLALIIARRNNSEVLIPDAFLPGADGYGKCSSY